MANYLISGAAGFIAARVAELLLAEGHSILGIDNLNDAYDPRMKAHRLDQLGKHSNFNFLEFDIADKAILEAVPAGTSFDGVINLAARAGVRASVENPWMYVDTNMTTILMIPKITTLDLIF